MTGEQLVLVPAPARGLRPFWRYYGGKWRGAPLYPQPKHRTIVEPFAGAAGYSLRYADHDVVLVEKYPPIAAIWRFLIAAQPHEVMAIPLVDTIDALPPWVPTGARHLVRHCLGAGLTRGINVASAGVRSNRERTDPLAGWSEGQRLRVASQVPRIKHWRVIEGDYTMAPRLPATWFIDPPYNNTAGAKYPCGPKAIDFVALASWCRDRPGQVIVCENAGADWLPFRTFGTFRRGMNGAGSREVIWTNEDGP